MVLSLGTEAKIDSNPLKTRTDSLKNALKDAQNHARADLLNQLSWEIRNVNIDSSIIYATQALTLSKEMDYANGRNHALNYIGIGHRNKSNYSIALDYFFNALRSSELSNDIKEQSYTLINIGNIYIYQTNYAGALSYFQRALENGLKINNKDIIAYSHSNLGRSYVGLEKYNEAELHINEAQDIREENSDTEGILILSVDLANLYLRQNRIDESLDLLSSNIAALKVLNHKSTLAYSYLTMAKIYLVKNERPNAKQYIELCLELTQKHGLKRNESIALALLSDIHESNKNYLQALRTFKSHIITKDSIYNEVNTRKIETLHAQYKTEKEKIKTSHLEAQSMLNRAIIERQEIIILLSVVTCILFLAIAIVASWFGNQRKRLNKQIHQQKDAAYRQNNTLIDINEEKNNLIRILSHDLRAPISNIKSLTQVHQLEHEDSFTDQENKTLNLIQSESDRLLTMIGEILDVEALNVEISELKSEQINVTSTMNNVIEGFTHMADQKLIKIHKLYTNEELIILGDTIHLHQVFENLLSNALKFSNENKNVYIAIEQTPAQIIISMKDEGQGMTIDDKSKLFKKFQQLSAKPTANEYSTGLGLSIVKQYVDQMKGTIVCESEVGVGTNFILTFDKKPTE